MVPRPRPRHHDRDRQRAALHGGPLSVHRVFLYRFDQQDFVGLANYLRAFRDPLYINSLKTTVVFTLGCLALSMVLGLLVAFLLSSRQVRMRPMWLALFLVPFVVTPVVTGIAWRFFMWQQEFGVINQVIGFFGGLSPYWLLECQCQGHYSIPWCSRHGICTTQVWGIPSGTF